MQWLHHVVHSCYCACPASYISSTTHLCSGSTLWPCPQMCSMQHHYSSFSTSCTLSCLHELASLHMYHPLVHGNPLPAWLPACLLSPACTHLQVHGDKAIMPHLQSPSYHLSCLFSMRLPAGPWETSLRPRPSCQLLACRWCQATMGRSRSRRGELLLLLLSVSFPARLAGPTAQQCSTRTGL
jgi:hypothetical protein